jgi:hypothetical protein
MEIKMKRIFTGFLALLMVGGLMLGDVQPILADTYIVSLDAPYRVAMGSDFITYVRTTRIDYLKTCKYDIVFDPALLRLDHVSDGLVPVISWDFISPGRYTITQEAVGDMGKTVSGSFAQLHFHVVSLQLVSASISTENEHIRRYDGDPINATWTNASMLIYQPTKIVSTIPINNTNEIALDTLISFNFSESMNPPLTQTAFSISPNVIGDFTWENGTVMKFTPNNALDYGITYTVTLFKSALDINDNPLSENYVFSFTTVPLTPEISTSKATTITAYNAVLNGKITNMGGHSNLKVCFEWGIISGNPDHVTPSVVMDGMGLYSTEISGLLPDQTYYFRAKVIDANVIGDELSFTTNKVAVNIVAPEIAPSDYDFKATVNIDEVYDLNACNYDITFDPDKLRLDSVTCGLIAGTIIPVVQYNEIRPGTWRIVNNTEGLSGIDGSGYLAVLHFHTIGSMGNDASIGMSNGIISNTSASQILAEWTGSSIHFAVLPGDANEDKVISVLDITAVVRIILELDPIGPGSDANRDGHINVLDITKIEEIILQLDQ